MSAPCAASRSRQDQPHRGQRHLARELRRLRPGQPVGRAGRGSGSDMLSLQRPEGGPMTYSYTQISQYLTCPRRYRHRYLDGWQEKDTRAAMLFGRCFEQAVAAFFRREDPAQPCSSSGTLCKDLGLPTRATTPGTACSSKAFSCSSASPRTDASTFASHVSNSRFDSLGRCVLATTLSPSSMLSANWTAHLVCWSGRPAPLAIQRSLPASRHWIRSWFVIPG